MLISYAKHMPSPAATVALASELRMSVMRLTRRLRAERPDQGLTLTQLAVLGTLDRHGPLTLGELAACEKVQPPSMTRTASSLEERGLVERLPSSTDKRQVRVQISRSGLALLREDRRRREAWLAGQLDGLSAEERALLAAAAPIIDRLAQS